MRCSSRFTRAPVCLLLASLLLHGRAAPLQAQQVLGTLRRSMDSLPVVGALIILSDSSGREVARAVSSERGVFSFTLAQGGPVRLRVLRIGLRPSGPHPVQVPAAGRIAVAFYLADLPIVLADLTVAGEQYRCGIPPDSSVLGVLLAEARKAIALTQATLEERRFLFAVETWRLRLTPDLQTVDSVTTASIDRGWPIRSAPPDSLRRWGFVRTEQDTIGNETDIYFGPDARLLATDWFLASRCLQLVQAPGPGLIAMQFRPEHTHRGIEIAGRFVFDSTSLALRELVFTWVGLPIWVPSTGPGGFVRFEPIPQGGWLPTAWSLRAPVPVTGVVSGTRLRGYMEYAGRVSGMVR